MWTVTAVVERRSDVPEGLGAGADGPTGVDGLEKTGLPVMNTFVNQQLIRLDGLDGLKMHIGGLRARPAVFREASARGRTISSYLAFSPVSPSRAATF